MKELEIVIYGRRSAGKTTLAVTIEDLLKESGIGQLVALIDTDKVSDLVNKRDRANHILKDAKITIRTQSYQREPVCNQDGTRTRVDPWLND